MYILQALPLERGEGYNWKMKHLPRWQRILYTILTALIALGMVGATFLYY